MWSSCSERGNRGLKPHRTVSLPTSMWLKPKVSQIELHTGKLSVDHMIYPLVNVYITMENHHAIKFGKPFISIRAIEKPWRTVRKSPFLIGKPSINGQFSMAKC